MESKKIKVGILGASGYAANELVRLILGHKNAKLIWLGSNSFENNPFFLAYQNFFKLIDLNCINGDNLNELCKEIDVLFLATPHNFAAKIINESILKQVVVIDLSADFRLQDKDEFKTWYKDEHKNPTLLKEAVYGLCELNRESIKNARLIANPGCYPTCSILSLAPLVKENLIHLDSIIIDAKSGVSGAGRGAKVDNLFCEVNENFKAYGIASHRHTPEIEQMLSKLANKKITLSFTPHLIPINRGILATIYANLKENLNQDQITRIYKDFYKDEFFVRVLDSNLSAQTRWIETSNFVDISINVDSRTNRAIIVGAMDNLVKGAAGQAIQNMNIIFGLDEKTSLESAPIFP